MKDEKIIDSETGIREKSEEELGSLDHLIQKLGKKPGETLCFSWRKSSKVYVKNKTEKLKEVGFESIDID